MALGDRDIHLFLGGDDGYGDAINVGRDSYHWTANWDARAKGRATPAAAPVIFASGALGRAPATAMFEWADTDAQPFLLIASGGSETTSARVIKFLNFTFSTDDVQAGNDRFLDGVLYRHDGSDADAETAFFCNGESNDVLRMRDIGGTYSDAASTKADHMAIIGSDLWISLGYKVQQLTTGSDPALTGSYGTAIPVGRPTYKVNKIVNFGGSPAVAKGDGFFVYNPAPVTAEYVPVVQVSPHPDNGLHTIADGRGRVYYDTVDGDIIVITPGFLSHQEPGRTFIDRDTPFGRISAFTVDLDHIYAAVDPGAVRTQQLGLTVQSKDQDVFTNHTSNVTDQDYSSSADWESLGTSGTDYVYVGADEPFAAIYFEIETSSGRTSAGTIADIEYSTGSDTWVSVADLDSTHVFLTDGVITIGVGTNAEDGNPYDLSTNQWATDTVNSVTDKYWVRIRATSGTAWTGVKVREVYVVPYRPPLDPDTFPTTGMFMAGAYSKILVGTWKGETLQWDDVWTLRASARIEQMVVSRASANVITAKRMLYMVGGANLWAVPVGDDGEGSAVRAAWPKLADYGESQTAFDEHVIAFSGHDFGLPQHVKRVQGKLSIDFPFRQSDDETYLVYWWDDDTDRYYRKELQPDESFVQNLEGEGRVLYTALLWKDGSRDAVAPYLRYVGVPAGEWEDLGPMHKYKADIASPMNR